MQKFNICVSIITDGYFIIEAVDKANAYELAYKMIQHIDNINLKNIDREIEILTITTV